MTDMMLRLGPRTEADVAARLAESAACLVGSGIATAEVPGWLAEHRRIQGYEVRPIAFSELDHWSFTDTGNLVHASGRFFTVEGVSITGSSGPIDSWQQPIIVQPEIGVLGILAKEFNGVLHFLMQAKMEPGNPNLVQLSPTVQATRSNYTQVHRGAPVSYLEYFIGKDRGRVLADVLQSEHGAWFYRKSNRNMIVEVTGEVEVRPGYQWLTLGQLGALLHYDDLVNMDARTVLSCAPVEHQEPGALWTDTALLSWFTGERSRHDLRTRLIPLGQTADWIRGSHTIEHAKGRYFKVMAAAVRAGDREVASWTQPLIEPVGRGVIAFLARRFGGVPHVLVQARAEAGFLDTVELGPTVQYIPDNHAHLSPADRPAFLDQVLAAEPDRIRYSAIHSEEGGRFLNAESRHLIIETDEADQAMTPRSAPPGFAWITPGQLSSLARHGHYVNVQARTLLAVFTTRAITLT